MWCQNGTLENGVRDCNNICKTQLSPIIAFECVERCKCCDLWMLEYMMAIRWKRRKILLKKWSWMKKIKILKNIRRRPVKVIPSLCPLTAVIARVKTVIFEGFWNPHERCDLNELQTVTRIVKWSTFAIMDPPVYPKCHGYYKRSICVYGLGDVHWVR